MRITVEQGGVAALWRATLQPGEVGLAWLGQAGFALRSPRTRVVIDPYLSDSLAEKYKGTAYPHTRMMPPPIAPEQLTNVDYLFSTHRHTDHLDASTIRPLVAASPHAKCVAAAAESEAVVKAGMPLERTLLVDAEQSHVLSDDLRINVLPAAHEDRRRDVEGRHHFLGYTLHLGGFSIYHSGDTIPFDGLEDAVRRTSPAVALLPVNGRDAERTARGIIGNMDFAEAVSLCRACGIKHFIPHHFGLFKFNTVDVDELQRKLRRVPDLSSVLPRADEWYRLAN